MAYEHILSLAYGRKGKLRRELLEVSTHIRLILWLANELDLFQPLLSDPSAPLPPPIIPPVESSRPPVYSPEMTALLTSTFARNGSPPRTQQQLRHPLNLPKRADPKSSEAKILGPLSKRREVNLRWRFFEEETAKVRVPIEVSRLHAIQTHTTQTGEIEGTDTRDTERLTPPPVGFQGTSVLHDLEAIASPNPNLPKRATSPSLPHSTTNNTSSTPTVNHFIRRQHRKLLGKIPILTYSKRPNSPMGQYEVSLSPFVCSESSTGLTSAVPMADEADLAWLRLPPPPQEPRVELDSTLSQKPEAKSKPDQNPRVDGKLEKYGPSWVDDGDPPDELQYRPMDGTPELQVELKPEVEDGPKVWVKSQVGQTPQVHVNPKDNVCLWSPRPALVDEPPSQPNRRPKENPKRPRRSDETTGERPRRE